MYQVFISYRRDGGEMLAMHLAHRLREKGINVFFDVETMRSGKFNEQIFNVIDDCNDFLLILTKDSLDRCVSPSDWVRLEIEHALKVKKNIIPVLGRNFDFPENLPESIDEIRFCNGIHADIEFFDAVVEKIISMLDTNVIPNQNTEQQNNEKNTEFLSLIKTDYDCLIEFHAALKTAEQERFNSASAAMQTAMLNTYTYYEREQLSFSEESKAAKKIVDMFNKFSELFNQFSAYPGTRRMSDEAQEIAFAAEKQFNSIIEYIVTFL